MSVEHHDLIHELGLHFLSVEQELALRLRFVSNRFLLQKLPRPTIKKKI